MTTLIFFIINIVFMLIVYIFGRIPAKSWEIILIQKHKKELGSVMVVITLLFGTSFGSALGYSYDNLNLVNNYFDISFTVVFFALMNATVLVTTSILATYLTHLFNNTDKLVIIMLAVVVLSMMSQETLKYHKNYIKQLNNESLKQIEIISDKL